MTVKLLYYLCPYGFFGYPDVDDKNKGNQQYKNTHPNNN